ncbi:MAG: response regulator [Planctomycetota bacterium]
MKVLLVDDEPELVSAISERLSLRGIEADWASSIDQVHRLIENNVYDLAVLDVKMPKVSGFELMQQLRDRFPKMKFIFLTGHASENDFRTCIAEPGVTHYLIKPLDIEVLTAKMNEVMDK